MSVTALPAAAAPTGDVGIVVFFAIGLLGGAHCLGMCGPMVTAYADGFGEGTRISWREIRQHGLFNLGRTAGYAVVGASMGLLGRLIYDAAAVASAADTVRAVAGVFAGLAIIAAGLGYLRSGSARAAGSLPVVGAAFSRASSLVAGRVQGWARGPGIVGLGALHAALPCPLLYPAFLYAFAAGSPVVGATSLAALGLGTFPTLLAYGLAFGSLSAGRRAGLHRALGVLFVLMGYLPLSHGLMLLGVPLPHPHIPIYQPLG
jgi:hypothetical protein